MTHEPETPSAPPNETPLQGWKEIAAYLERDVRTARRWELDEALPVRRHRTDRRSSVYAYSSEIEAWRAARPSPGEVEQPASRWPRRSAWAALAAAAAALAAIAYGPILNPKAPIAEAAEGSMRDEVVWADAAANYSASLSPDGKLLSYTDWSTGEIWVRDLATGEGRAISNDGPWEETRSFAETSAISPDGKHVAASWYNDEIQNYEGRVGNLAAPGETDNGTAVFQTPKGQAGWVQAVGWLSNSKALFVYSFGFANGVTRFTIADIARNETVTLKTFGWDAPVEPTVSPDGRWIAYGHRHNPEDRTHDISILASDGSIESVAVEHPAEDIPVAWTPDGEHLLFRSVRTTGQSLWALPVLDGKPAGAPRMISPDISAIRTFGFSAGGELYYLKRTGSRDIYEAKVNLSTGSVIEKPQPVAAGFVGDNVDPIYSPDGRLMAYLSDRALHGFGGYGSRIIVVRDLGTGEERELTPAGLAVSEIAWEPDSQSVLFKGRSREGRFGAYRFGIQSKEPELLFRLSPREKGNPRNFGWMADGKSIFYFDPTAGSGQNGAHMIHDLSTGQDKVLIQPNASGSRISLSPDGKHFARWEHHYDDQAVVLAIADASTAQERELLRLPVAKGSCCPPMTTTWSVDGSSILFWTNPLEQKNSPHPKVSELWTIPSSGGEARKTDLAVEGLARPNMTLSLHPDGKRIAFAAGDRKDEVWKLSNFLDRLTASD